MDGLLVAGEELLLADRRGVAGQEVLEFFQDADRVATGMLVEQLSGALKAALFFNQ